MSILSSMVPFEKALRRAEGWRPGVPRLLVASGGRRLSGMVRRQAAVRASTGRNPYWFLVMRCDLGAAHGDLNAVKAPPHRRRALGRDGVAAVCVSAAEHRCRTAPMFQLGHGVPVTAHRRRYEFRRYLRAGAARRSEVDWLLGQRREAELAVRRGPSALWCVDARTRTAGVTELYNAMRRRVGSPDR